MSDQNFFQGDFLFKSLFHTLRFGIFATKFKGHGTCEPIFHTIKLWSQQECYFWFCVCQHYLIGKLFLGCYCMVISDKNVLQFDILWSHQKPKIWFFKVYWLFKLILIKSIDISFNLHFEERKHFATARHKNIILKNWWKLVITICIIIKCLEIAVMDKYRLIWNKFHLQFEDKGVYNNVCLPPIGISLWGTLLIRRFKYLR